MNYKRIFILGTTGTGKTHLAYLLSKKLKIKKYSLDDVYWKRKYDIKRTEKERDKELKKITKNKRWIIEGIYSHWPKKAAKKVT
jgi:adenylate kinase family enzyme